MERTNLVSVDSRAGASAAAMVINCDAQWRAALSDSPDGKRIVNADGVLRHEDERKIREKVIQVRRKALFGIQDLMAAGVTVSESITTKLIGHETIGEMQEAVRSMNPVDVENNALDYVLNYTPLPIVTHGWRIPWRDKGFAYKHATGLPESVYQVGYSLEGMLFNGATEIKVNVGGTNVSVYGYTTHPDRRTETITDWGLLATTGVTIVGEVLAMVDNLFTNVHIVLPNSLILYVSNDFWMKMQEDYSAVKGEGTILKRILAINEIKDVRPANRLAAQSAVMVEMSEQTIELVVASDIVTIPHVITNPLGDLKFTTYAAMVPIIKSDRNSKTGICHATV